MIRNLILYLSIYLLPKFADELMILDYKRTVGKSSTGINLEIERKL